MTEVKEKLLTAEQMVMWRQKHHSDTHELNAENRKNFNRKIRKMLEAMSPAELSATKTLMQGEWDALPAEKKAKYQERIAAKAQKTADKLAAGGGDDEED